MQKPDSTTEIDLNSLAHSSLPLAKWLRSDVLILLGLFCIFYFFKLSTLSLSIDDEMGALGAHKQSWVLAGHWGVYLFERFIVAQAVVPFFPIFLFGLALAISYVLLLSIFGIQQLEPVHYLAFAFYAAFPTWAFLAAFTAYIASGGLGLLLTILAVYCLRIAGNGMSRWWYAATVATLAFAIGCYQSFLFLFLVIAVALETIALRDYRRSPRMMLHRAAQLAATAAAGVVVYKAIDMLLHQVLQLPYSNYVDGFIDWRELVHSPVLVIGKTIKSMLAVYGGAAEIYGTFASAFPAVIAIGVIALVAAPNIPARRRVLLAIMAAIILCFPLLLNFISGGAMPSRTLVAVPVVFWVFAMLGMTAHRRAIALCAFAVALLAVLQMLYSASLLQAANHFARLHDAALAEEVDARIVAANPDSDGTKTYRVDFYGSQSFTSVFPRPFSSSMGFSFFEWDGGNPTRILNYMRLLGYANLELVPMEQRQQDLATFATMSSWPAKDSVRVVGDTTLIKLGSAPGIPFNQH